MTYSSHHYNTMKCQCVILAVHCCVALVFAAPLSEHDDAVRRAAESGMTLAKKILNDIPRVHDACVKTTGLTLELSGSVNHLEYLSSEINIPAAPALKTVSQDYSLEMSVSAVMEGLNLYRDLLEDLRDFMSFSESLDPLLADISELCVHVQQLTPIVMTVSQRNTPEISSRLNSDYKAQVAVHLSLQQLRTFTQDVYRSLRYVLLFN